MQSLQRESIGTIRLVQYLNAKNKKVWRVFVKNDLILDGQTKKPNVLSLVSQYRQEMAFIANYCKDIKAVNDIKVITAYLSGEALSSNDIEWLQKLGSKEELQDYAESAMSLLFEEAKSNYKTKN